MKFFTGPMAVVMLIATFTACSFQNNKSSSEPKGDIVSFEVEGQASVNIDSRNKIVDIVLDESVDISNLKIHKFEISDGATTDSEVGPTINLTEPYSLSITTSAGRSYQWRIKAEQPVERFIKCNGLIDVIYTPKERSALVSVADDIPLDSIVITAMKLGSSGSRIVSTTGYDFATKRERTQSMSFPATLDCTLTRVFKVAQNGVEHDWTITFVQKMAQNEIKNISIWTYYVDVEGEFNGNGSPYFEYRRRIENDWKKCGKVEIDGLTVKAKINGLSAGTDYYVRLVSDHVVGQEIMFTTDVPQQISDMGFNVWHYGGDNGRTWCPYVADDNTPSWNTLNPGMSDIIDNTVVPENEHKIEGKSAAKIMSKSAVVKFAPGVLYTGKFLGFEDMVSEYSLGIPFDSRPYSLKGWYDYRPGVINCDEMKRHPNLVGKQDLMLIQVALVAEGIDGAVGPYVINSENPGKIDLKTDSRVIAYAEFTGSNTTSDYTEFELPLQYKPGDKRKPAYAVILATSSAKGQFQTGSDESVLYIDGLKFIYK